MQYWNGLIEQARAEKLLRPELASSLTRALIIGMIQRTAVWFDANIGPVDRLITVVLELLSGMWVEPAGGTKPKTGIKTKGESAAAAPRGGAKKKSSRGR